MSTSSGQTQAMQDSAGSGPGYDVDALAGVLERIDDLGTLLERTDADPFVRWGARATPQPVAWAHGRAVMIVRPPGKGRIRPYTGAFTFGPPHDLDGLLGAVAASDAVERIRLRSISVPQEHRAIADKHFTFGGGGEWDWMWTDQQPPAMAGEDRIVELDDERDAAMIAQFSEAYSPTAEGEPGAGVTYCWLAILDDAGAPLALGGLQRMSSGAPHLAGIVTHADHRGKGLGRAVSAALTRRALAEDGIATLGMYTANDTARRLYTALGYRTAYAWCSRRLEN